jgi:hypothetical protein
MACEVTETQRRILWESPDYQVHHRCCPDCPPDTIGGIIWGFQSDNPTMIYVCLRGLAFADPVLFHNVMIAIADKRQNSLHRSPIVQAAA